MKTRWLCSSVLLAGGIGMGVLASVAYAEDADACSRVCGRYA